MHYVSLSDCLYVEGVTSEKYASLGALYNPTEGIKALASSGKSYYQI